MTSEHEGEHSIDVTEIDVQSLSEASCRYGGSRPAPESPETFSVSAAYHGNAQRICHSSVQIFVNGDYCSRTEL